MKATINHYRANDGIYVGAHGAYDFIAPKQNLLKWLSGKQQKVVDGKTVVKLDSIIDEFPQGLVLDTLKRLRS